MRMGNIVKSGRTVYYSAKRTKSSGNVDGGFVNTQSPDWSVVKIRKRSISKGIIGKKAKNVLDIGNKTNYVVFL